MTAVAPPVSQIVTFRLGDELFTADIFSVLAVQNSVKSRVSFGGTAPSEVRKQIRYWKKRLAKA